MLGCILKCRQSTENVILNTHTQEDIEEEPAPRMFWPREIWGKHAETLADLKEAENATAAVACLNDMVRATVVLTRVGDLDGS